jgi:hypothetical protein
MLGVVGGIVGAMVCGAALSMVGGESRPVKDHPVAAPALLPCFVGNTLHLEGKVALGEKPIEISHAFRLKNVGLVPITVEKSVASCGCTEALPPKEEILPGTELVVPVTMKLTTPGVRTERVWLQLSDNQIQELSMSAVGVVKGALYVRPATVALPDAQGEATVTLILTQKETSVPPDVTFAENEAVEISARPWVLVHEAIPSSGASARWLAEATVRLKPSRNLKVIERGMFEVPGFGSAELNIRTKTWAW